MEDIGDKTTKREPLGVKGDFEIGQTIGGKYKLLSKLGSGGIGTVYQVQQVFLNKEFALKTIDIRTVSNVAVQRFQMEAKIASSLNHPNLVHVYDFGILDNDQPYLVMDLVKGITFAQYLKENGPLAIDQVTAFFAPACFGLLAAHDQGLVHRDIKPGNIMVMTDLPLSSAERIKVVDFGIAKNLNRESGEIQALTATGEVFGSPLYMSPEQCAGGIVDHRSDIYSLGCVLFEMLTGTPPFFAQNALATMMLHESGVPPTLKEASLGKDFPGALESLVAKMLRKVPTERYQSMGLVAHDLAIICQSQGHDSVEVGKSAQSSKQKSSQTNKSVTMPASQLYALLATTAVIPAALSWFGGYSFQQNQTPQKQEIQQNSQKEEDQPPGQSLGKIPLGIEDQELAEKRRILEETGPIKPKIVVRGNTKKRMYVFPKIPVGAIYTYNSANPFGDKVEIGPAQGVVYAPLNTDLALELMGDAPLPALLTPSIFQKLVGAEFRSLYLSNASLTSATIGTKVDTSAAAESRNTANIIKNVSGWSGFETLRFKDSFIGQDCLAALNKLHGLENFGVERSDLDRQNLAQQPFLKNLKRLHLFDQCLDGASYEELMHQLAHSSELNNFRFSLPNDIRHPGAIAELRHCQNLRELAVLMKLSDTNDALIDGICQLKNVRQLYLQEKGLSLAQLQKLSHCPWFVQIILTSDQYSLDLQAQLKRMDPRLIFI